MTATDHVELVVSAGGSVSLVGEPPSLPPLTMAAKAESVASVTSQCSFSSTIVHVGDKKPPESGGDHQHQHSHSLNPIARAMQQLSGPYLLYLLYLCRPVTLLCCSVKTDSQSVFTTLKVLRIILQKPVTT